MSRLGRVKKLDKLTGTREFKLLIVEKVGDDLYQKWNDTETYKSQDLDELVEYYKLDAEKDRISYRAEIIERKLFGTKD